MDHDHSHKLLFSHAERVADLLRGFVLEDGVAEFGFPYSPAKKIGIHAPMAHSGPCSP